jgi:hypothetical protein
MKPSVTESPGYYELEQHKLWFVDKCSKLFNQRKQSKFLWLQNSNEINGYNLNNVRCETRRGLGMRKKISGRKNELNTNSNIKNISDLNRGINEFKKGY